MQGCPIRFLCGPHEHLDKGSRAALLPHELPWGPHCSKILPWWDSLSMEKCSNTHFKGSKWSFWEQNWNPGSISSKIGQKIIKIRQKLAKLWQFQGSAGRKNGSGGPHAARGPHFGHPCFKQLMKKLQRVFTSNWPKTLNVWGKVAI